MFKIKTGDEIIIGNPEPENLVEWFIGLFERKDKDLEHFIKHKVYEISKVTTSSIWAKNECGIEICFSINDLRVFKVG